MTTPASNTPKGIIFDAMQDAGLLQDGQEPNSEQYAKYLRRLLDLINYEQTQGIKLWLNTDQSITLLAGTAKYSMGPLGNVVMTKPTRVVQGYYLDTNSIKRPLVVLSRDEYTRLSTVVQTGAVNSYFIDKQQATLDAYFWLTPDATAATGTAHLIIQQQVTNPTNLYDTMNFPEEWRMFLRWGLADEISTGQPQAIMDRCAGKAEIYRMALEAWDVEDASTMFTPDQRSAYTQGSFR